MADNQGAVDKDAAQARLDGIPAFACDLVYGHVMNNLDITDKHITFSRDEVYVVWFNFTLGNWKALVSTSLPDGRYYEVTFNGLKGEVYIDTYVKIDNRCIKNV